MTYEQWQQERRTALTSPTGNLALVDYQPVRKPEPQPVNDIPAYVATSAEGGGVLLTAAARDGVRMDGQVVDGRVFVPGLRPDGTPVVSWDRYSFDVFSLDGTDYELRIYDAQASNLANFDHVEYYPEDPGLAIEATYRAHEAPERVAWDFTRTSDAGHRKQVPGIVDITVGGETYELLVFLDGPMLVLCFADGTTGTESYAPGRFLRMPRPDATGSVVVDFNRAFIPPCGFSDYYSCPLPPRQNRLEAPIRAGEKTVHWKRPRY